MGSSLRPVLANIIMTELEHIVINHLLPMAQLSFIPILLMIPYW